MKSIEHIEQVNVVKWFALQHPKLRLFAIPNAAKRSVKLAGYMKNEGLSAGVPDIFIMLCHAWLQWIICRNEVAKRESY